ncbi:ammonium transporter AmtB-like domain-containing protein [Podospora didyma]|uniref:Ammonium transporter AmtB-like domain-containing protein n=1 Tax=Podospora didyma TaxID=330526 RepID=A0AAE0NY72_9PEZI|nr:ammonium transporter AmtB-like domain-containing protein [Podospora didyma]
MASVTLVALAPPTMATASVVAYADILRHPEQFYSGADIVWVMISSALVFIMIPSLSLIYSGLGNRSFALTLFRLPMLTGAFIGVQWVLWGYLVTFSDSILPSNWWGGESRAGGYKDVLGMPVSVGDGPDTSAVIPELVFALYEGMFASFTAAVVCGGTMHRARPRRFIVFISIWSLLVYDPVARWSWSADGWLRTLGSLDFAGGTPVHIVSGTTVAAFAVFCSIESRGSLRAFARAAVRKVWSRVGHLFHIIWSILRIILLLCSFGRVNLPESQDPPSEAVAPSGGEESFPYNINFVVLGTAFLWFGWAGFNGGSALGGNLRAVSAWTSTHVAACAGGVTGTLWIWIIKGMPDSDTDGELANSPTDETKRNNVMARQAFDRLSVWFFCDGAISGLVAITPAAGYVPVWSAVVFGVVGALGVNFLKKETEVFLRHDPLQIFAVHAGGGVIGMVLTGLFVDSVTVGLDGHSTIPHPEYSMAQRVGYQLADSASGMAYTFFMTLAILYFMKVVAYLFGGLPWSQTAVYSDSNRLEDEFQAIIQQQWRGNLDPEGRPYTVKLGQIEQLQQLGLSPPVELPAQRQPPERPPRDDIPMDQLTARSLSIPPRSASSGGITTPPWGGSTVGSQGMVRPWGATSTTPSASPWIASPIIQEMPTWSGNSTRL